MPSTETGTEKRLYTFPHFMLSPLAKGIQSTHSTVELFNKYVPHKGNNYEVKSNDDSEKDTFEVLFDWSINHKTEIMLNPGTSQGLEELEYLMQVPENFYPWAAFYEDEESLKGIMTSISIVLTEKIYNTASLFRTGNFNFNLNNYGRVLCKDESKCDTKDLILLYNYGRFNSFEMEMVEILSTFRLAQ